MHPTTIITMAIAGLFWPLAASAQPELAVPPGGGLPALDVRVDLAARAVVAGGTAIPIALDAPRMPSEGEVTIEAVPIGGGRSVVHVRVPSAGDGDGLAWEAIFAGGRQQPIFAGVTGLAAGDPGERTGKAVEIVVEGGSHFVLVGDIREDLTICGQATTLIDPLALYPASLELRPATLQRLGAAERAAAEPIEATPATPGSPGPLAKLLMARGSSVPGTRGGELTDGDPRTLWTERRPGVGQGEFVVMAAPAQVPIARVRVVLGPPPSPMPEGAAPQTFYLTTGRRTFEVTIPDDGWTKPGAYDVVFSQPLETSCLALVLGSAYTRGLAHPEVSVADLEAFGTLDTPGATLDDVARELSGKRATAAAQLLERAGGQALGAVERAFDSLDARGRALAVDVAAAHDPCEEAAPLLARGLCGHDGQAPRKAREKLERCPAAAPALAADLREDAARRACLAPALAALAPSLALDPIADAMAATPEDDAATRAVLRSAFAEALESAPPGAVARIAGDAHRSAAARLEVLRAAEGRVREAPAEAETTVAELLAGRPPMRTRYLVLGPLEQLAHAGDATAADRIATAMTRDPDWPVRARAAEAGAGLPAAQAALVAAARDAEPRVREAALESLAGASAAAAIDVAREALQKDGWSFVRVQAAGVLAKAPASADVDDALGGALRDRSVRVRGVALVGLARRRAWSSRKAIRERLDDRDEDAEVRAAAARALGGVCDSGAADRLTELARGLGSPGASDDDQQIALAALVGLAALHPSDLRDRLAPLVAPRAPPYARAAAEKALAARPACPR